MSDPIWTPTKEVLERANVVRLMAREGIEHYDQLVRRSQEDPEWFWPAAIEDMGLEFDRPWSRIYDDSRGVEWTTWFDGGRVSIAWNCVHRWAVGEHRDRTAVVFSGEDGARRALTFGELSREVTRFAEALAALGIGAGDVVALFLPMAPEVAIASHACAHLGAIQLPIFSGFAASAVASRLEDSGAKVVVTADGSLRRGRVHPMKEIVDEAIGPGTTVEHVVVWRRLGDDAVAMREGRDVYWDEIVAEQPGELPAAQVESETPYLLTYTSGTTGRAKGVVHVQAGFLVSITREVCYQADAHPEDVIHFSTDMGWIMGPWTLVGGGALGATLVLAEGAPDWPADRLWSLLESERVTILGISPTLTRALIPHGEPVTNLSSLRTIVTTGEPWNPTPYRWLFEKVGGGRCPIINCSGGTEVAACFLSPTPARPIKECSLGGPALGMSVDIVDEIGQPVARGEVGELVCRRPWPGMTRGFWRDPGRYLETYWRRFPGVWTHGDWASVDTDGDWYLHGRSDDTLNIGGKRIGPAEIESAAVAHPAVTEAAAIGVPHEVKGEVAWVFCTTSSASPDDGLAQEVADRIGQEIGKAFKPERVLFVPALPKTRSAKIVRRAVRSKVLGHDPGDLSSLENPDALDRIPARASVLG